MWTGDHSQQRWDRRCWEIDQPFVVATSAPRRRRTAQRRRRLKGRSGRVAGRACAHAASLVHAIIRATQRKRAHRKAKCCQTQSRAATLSEHAPKRTLFGSESRRGACPIRATGLELRDGVLMGLRGVVERGTPRAKAVD